MFFNWKRGEHLRTERTKNRRAINARVGSQLLSLPRDFFAKCGAYRREKRCKISRLRVPYAQRDEIARLKGGPGRPNIKPSGMDKATEPRPPPPTGSEPRQKGGKTSKLSIHEERTVTIAAPPQGSRFKGYTNFAVQDLVIRSHVVNFRRERWKKPDGDMMTAPLPAGISGHFGPELRRFVLAQYHQGQVTVPRLLAQLRAFGIVISKRQLVRLLIAGQDGFLAENREVLRAGSDAGSATVPARALSSRPQKPEISVSMTANPSRRDRPQPHI